MKKEVFIGREKELSLLNNLLKKKSASLVAIKGRRRVGKSRLIREFGQSFRLISLAGLAPSPGMTADKQRKAFAEQLVKTCHIPEPNSDNWTNLFHALGIETALKTEPKSDAGRVIILLDEISWMAQGDDTFLAKLKDAWDTQFQHNPQLILVLCGSISSWIDKNILKNTAFVGRLSLILHLEELSLFESQAFFGKQSTRMSAYEKFKILAVTGGIPKYLEEIIPEETAESNIQRLCFQKEGMLYFEFQTLFNDLFGRRSQIYTDLLKALIKKPFATLQDIYQELGVNKQSIISDYLDDLEQAGFIRRHYTWKLHDQQESRHSQFHISDNYVRFYLKYIQPNARKIEKGDFDHPQISMDALPAWDSIMGLQFENLVLSNRRALLKKLKINPANILYDNPYFQKATQTQEGCQIDYLIQDKYNCLFIIEIKFSKNPIPKSVITSVQEKIHKLPLTPHMSYRPVLIHVNGVDKSLEDENYFTHIINFGEFLKEDFSK